jgi:hypothetical protein
VDGYVINLDGVAYTDIASMLHVTDGTKINYPSDIVSMTVGKPYSQCVETLDLPFAPGSGQDLTLNRRAIKKAAFEVANTGIGFQVGESVDGDLVTWSPETSDIPDTFNRYQGLVHTPIFGTWDRSGRMALVNEYPTPITISALIREVEFGDT